jgi:penicillin-binding protein 1A
MRFGWPLVLSTAFTFGLAFAMFQYVVHDLPQLDSIADYRPPLASRVLDSEGNVIGEFFTERRTLVAVSQLPAHVRNSFLAAEDADFYNHTGIDYFGILRALLNEIKYKIMGGQRIGGSTITQQTAKTMLLSRQRTYTRKIREFILAKRIEDTLNKDEILNLYLNQIYFGNGAYGIEEAARTYYGVSAKDLTLGQAAALASVPKSPNRINPIKDSERVKARRDYVLEQMVVHGFAPQSLTQLAKNESAAAKPLDLPYLNRAPYYTEEIRRILVAKLGEDTVYHGGLTIHTPVNMHIQIAAQNALRLGLRELDKRQGYRGPVVRLEPKILKQFKTELLNKKASLFSNTHAVHLWDLSLLTSQILTQDFKEALSAIRIVPLQPGIIIAGLVKTVSNANKNVTIDLGQQNATLPFTKMTWARAFNTTRYTPAPKTPSDVLKVGDIVLVKVEKIVPSIEVSLEQKPLVEGAIAAIEPHTHRVLAMVGGYDFQTSSFNRATQAKRQPGSSFKPFVYATAINSKAATAATLITDAPKVYGDGQNSSQWKPKNSTGKFRGDITVHSCLVSSVNTCSITLLERVGIDAVRKLAADAGELSEGTQLPRDLTIALGSGEVIPLAHFNAFAIFPNGGRYEPPVLIEKVISRDGKVLYEAPMMEPTQVISPQTAYVMTNIMRGLMGGAPLAGKTGTTNEFRSAWFVGFSQDLVAGVYVGFDNNLVLGMNEYGAVAAKPIWNYLMREANNVIPPREFVQPEGVVWRLIDPQTGLLATKTAAYDPTTADSQLADESDVQSEAEQRPKGAMLEAFIEGTEPTKSAGDSGPPPLELYDVGGLKP